MPTIEMGEDITPYYTEPMNDTLVVMYTNDTYPNSSACGDKLTKLHKELQQLDFPYFFVKIKTTHKNIKQELDALKDLYSVSEFNSIEFEIVEGNFEKSVYKGDTYCALPWVHKYVNPQGLVMPCCIGNEDYPIGNINNNSLDDISTLPIRKQMMQGERPDACNACYKREDSGLTSSRHNVNRHWKKYANQQAFVLRHLDIRLSNKCNLMCRMCSGKFSNRIAHEEQNLYGSTKYKDEVLSPELVEKQLAYIEKNIHTIENVYFAGGEPLMNEEHYRILQMFIDYKKTDVSLSYNTNFSMLKFKKFNVLKMWEQFDIVELGASIDLIGPQSNYVRYGVKYDVLENNYNAVKDIPNIKFSITSILHLMNIFNLPKLQKRWIDLGLDCNNISFQLLLDPSEQSITVLTDEYKQEALSDIDIHIKYLLTVPNSTTLVNQWTQAKEFMMSRDDTNQLAKFFRLTDDKDRARNQKFEDYFPEFKDLRKYVK